MRVGLHKQPLKNSRSGFTIVELLVVIVVIAILAAIVTIAYNGVRQRAIDSRLKSELSQAAGKLAAYTTLNNDLFPTALSETGVTSSSTEGQTTYVYNTSPDRTIYCLQAINNGRTYFVLGNNTNPQTGYCDGTTGVPSDGNYVASQVDNSGSQTQVVSNSTGTSQFYTVDIPAGVDYVSFHTSGGTEVGTWGVNMRVRQGAAPTSGTNDCSSTNSSQNFENCYMMNPTAGTWHVELFPWNGSETYSNVNLVFEWGYFEGAYSGPETLTAGYWNRKYYTVEVAPGTDYLHVTTTGGTDTGWAANLAVRYNARPGNTTSPTSGSTCNSQSTGNSEEECFIMNPTPGTWHILVMSNSSASSEGTYNNVTFEVQQGSYAGTYSSPLTLSAGPWARKIYNYNVPAGSDYVTFTTSGGTETTYGANLAVKAGSVPGTSGLPYSSVDCYSMGNDNQENCYMYNPTPGTWYADVYSGSTTYSGTYNNISFTIQSGNWAGAYTAPVVLSGGILTRTMYTLNVPAGKTSLTVTLSGGTETDYGANLAIRYNAPPGSNTNITSSNDCYSMGSTNAESCTINNPTAGTWYLMVASGTNSLGNTSTYNNVTLTATMAP